MLVKLLTNSSVITTILNMRSPGIRLHKLALFGWAVVITAVLLLLSLPVLAGNLLLCRLKIWLYAGKSYEDNPQKTVGLVSLRGFSETKRQSSLIIKKNKANRVFARDYSSAVRPLPYASFNYYLAGLIEGDGTIIVPSSEKDQKGRKTYPSIQIVFALMDLPLALKVQETLGHGSISRKKSKAAYIFAVNSKEGLIKIINLLNGKFKTDKIYALSKLIEWYKVKGLNLNLLPKSIIPLDSSSWLAGFIEADGHFSIRATEKVVYPKVECKFELSQAQNSIHGTSYIIMQKISEFLSAPLKSIRETSSNPQYRVRTLNSKSNLKLISYLKTYPMKGKKHLDFLSWCEIANVFIAGKVKHKELLPRAKSLKAQMNHERKTFTWNHLADFYIIEE